MEEKLNQLLPIGSVVLLRNAKKRLMITGVFPIQTEEEEVYDYIAVIYPEGYIGPRSNYVFNHGDIEEILFKGYDDEERKGYMDVMKKTMEVAFETMKNAEE